MTDTQTNQHQEQTSNIKVTPITLEKVADCVWKTSGENQDLFCKRCSGYQEAKSCYLKRWEIRA